MVEVATFLDLPRFPDVTEDCYLHPNILCMKYLMEVNLPGKQVACVSRKLSLTLIPLSRMQRPLRSQASGATRQGMAT